MLNAFRHHRGGHHSCSGDCDDLAGCIIVRDVPTVTDNDSVFELGIQGGAEAGDGHIREASDRQLFLGIGASNVVFDMDITVPDLVNVGTATLPDNCDSLTIQNNLAISFGDCHNAILHTDLWHLAACIAMRWRSWLANWLAMRWRSWLAMRWRNWLANWWSNVIVFAIKIGMENRLTVDRLANNGRSALAVSRWDDQMMNARGERYAAQEAA